MLIGSQEKLAAFIKRSFSGNETEIISELLQNCQRAGATEVSILTETTDSEDSVIVFADNGQGLSSNPGTNSQFCPLITIASSYYQNEKVENEQKPLGVGLFSLLAHPEIKAVELHSNGLCLTLTPDEVWSNQDFWQNNNWEKNITPSEIRSGLTISVRSAASFAFKLKKCFLCPYPKLSNPALGYEDYFTLTLDGKTVSTAKLRPEDMMTVLADTEYEGNRLVIGLSKNNHGDNTVYWFGQQIVLGQTNRRFVFWYDVKEGTPLNLLAPTRQSIIKDQKSFDFFRFIKTKLREFVLHPDNESRLTPTLIHAFYSEDAEWAAENLPFYLAEQLCRKTDSGAVELSGEVKILRYDEDHLVLKDGVIIAAESDNTIYLADSGLSTFTPELENLSGEEKKPVFVWSAGNINRLPVQYLCWKPGQADLQFHFFRAKGSFCLVSADIFASLASPPSWFEEGLPILDESRFDWKPLTQKQNVFVFSTPAYWEINDCEDLLAGVSEPDDKLEFLKNEVWTIWSGDDDTASYNELSESFKENLNSIRQKLAGNAVLRNVLDLTSIRKQFGIKPDEIIISLQPDEKGLTVTTDRQTLTRVWLN